MRGLTITGIILIVVFATGCQVKPDRAESERLSGKEIESLFTGKTVESFNLKSGSTSFTFYHPDGRVEQERYWKKRSGSWKINDKSEICLAMEGKPFSCRSIFRKGSKYYKYRTNAEGHLEKFIRYRQFIDGRVI